ncbi:MAG: translocation/assembly module TamB domain-containing protein, partial [Clostridia bacterium]|nr:translocation/assembly module TamB domain-containing protein [Deltaproteobacteria bacterium]
PSDLAGLPDPIHVVLEANVTMQRADIARFTAEGDGARLDASGIVPLDPNGRFDVKLLLTHKRPNATLAATGQTAPVSIDSLELRAQATGSLANLVADALLDAHGVNAQGVGPADVLIPLHVEGGTATVRDARVKLPAGALRLNASVGVLDNHGKPRSAMPLRVKLAAADVDLEPLTQKRAAGRLVFDVDAHGTVQAPQGSAHIGVDKFTANGVMFDKADARISMTPQRVTLEELTLDPRDGGKLNAGGTYGLHDSKIDATIDIENLPLRSVLALTAPTVPLSGAVSAKVHVTGVATEPRLDGHLTIAELASGTIALGKLSVAFDTQQEKVHGVMKLAGSLGTADLDAIITPRTQAVVAKLDIGDVRLARALSAADLSLPLDGTLTMTAKADGVLPYPKLEAALKIDDLLIDGVAPNPNTVSLDVSSEADQSYVAKLAFGEILAAEARYWPLRNTADVKARFHELKASAFSPELHRQGLDLMVSGNTDVLYGGPMKIQGTFTLEAFEAKIQHEMVKLSRPTTVRFDGSSVTLPKTDFEGAGSTLSLQGKLDGRAIQADVHGDLNLTVLGPFQNAISEPTGVLRLEAQARGTLDQPLFTGKIAVAKEVRGQPRGIPQELDVRSGSITLTPNTVQFDDIAGRLEEGSFKISGEIGLKDLMPDRYNLYLEGKRLSFQTRELRVEADASLKLTGSGKIVPDVSGEIVVVSGRYLKKFALKDFNFIGKQPDTSAPLSQTAPMLKQMNLNIHATNAEDIEVKVDASAFAVTLPLQMDLRVQGTPLVLNVGGKVTAQAGSIKFPEATLNIVETLVTFTPGLPPADGANLTLLAEGEVPSKSDDTSADEVYLVSMSLSGTLAALTFDLSAAPGLDRNQTLALLITGKAGFDQLFYGQGKTTGTASGNSTSPEVDAAIALAGAGVTGPLTGFVENQLEDRLNLKVDLSASVTSDQVRVTARKELTPRLRIEG